MVTKIKKYFQACNLFYLIVVIRVSINYFKNLKIIKMDVGEVIIPVVVVTGAFLMVLGLRHMQNKENMAMIERGMDLSQPKRRRKGGYGALKFGLLLVGAGLGLFLSFLLDNTVWTHSSGDEMIPLYFSLVGALGGLGLVMAHYIERKEEKEDKEQNNI